MDDPDRAKLAFENLLLQEKLNSNESESRLLKEENAFLKEKLAKQQKEEADIYHYLHQKLDQNLALTNALERELATTKELSNTHLAEKQEELETLRRQASEANGALQQQIRGMQVQLEKLRVFQHEKDLIEAHVARLTSELETLEKRFHEELSEMERKNIHEKNRMKQEMLDRIKETKQTLLSMTQDQLDTTTKRTMMENDHVIAELQYQSQETDKLLAKYRELEDQVVHLRIELKASKDTQALMAQKNFFYQKMLRNLKKRIKTEYMSAKQIELALEEEGQAVEEEKNFSRKHQSSETAPGSPNKDPNSEDNEALVNQVESLRAQLDRTTTNYDQAMEWVHLFRKEKQLLIAQQDQVVHFLLKAISEVTCEIQKQQRHQPPSNDETSTSSTAISPKEPKFSQAVRSLTQSDENHEDLVQLGIFMIPLPLDELSSEKTLQVLNLLMEKMKTYQQNLAEFFNVKCGTTREILERQFGVSLPPISSPVKLLPKANQTRPQMRPEIDTFNFMLKSCVAAPQLIIKAKKTTNRVFGAGSSPSGARKFHQARPPSVTSAASSPNRIV